MAEMISGFYRDHAKALAVQDLLEQHGFASADISLVPSEAEGAASRVSVRASFGQASKAIGVMQENDPLRIETDAASSDHDGGAGLSDPAPLSHALGLPLLSGNPAPLSAFLNIPTLSKGSLSARLGWRELSDKPAPLSAALKLPVLSGKAAPLSALLGLPVLSGKPAPLSGALGLSVLSANPAPLSAALGMKTLSDNPTPLSSLLGLPVLSKDD